ncbi:MAG: glutathione peroxidase [Ignavibacteriaceae bacterium]|nr:glutathione peroxidase [Ignavibacteriaceae bacterium]
MNNISSFKVKDITGKEISLSDFKGKVLLIVNVASKCGYTPQYKGLQELYKKYKPKGLEILGFPCNDFGRQEPGSNEEIQNFCSMNYGVTFKLFDKVKVLGKDKNKLYAVLTDNDITGTSDIKWNFEKFLISKNGEIVARYPSKVKPDDEKLILAIEEELKK